MSDAAFRQQIMAAPEATLQSAGIAVPQGMRVLVSENTTKLANLVLLAKEQGATSDAIAQAIAAPGDSGSRTANLEAYARLMLQTWTAGDLKARLLANPGQVLAAHGITVPAGLQVRIVEATEELAHLVLPALSASSASPSLPASSGIPSGPTGQTGQDITWLASSVTGNFSALASLITASSYLAGAAFAAASAEKFQVHKDNPTQSPVGSPIAFFLLSAGSVLGTSSGS